MIDFLYTIGLIFAIQLVGFLIASFFKTDKLTDLLYGGCVVVLAIYMYMNSSMFFEHTLLMVVLIVRGVRLSWYLFWRILHMKKDERFNTMREKPLQFAKFRLLQAVALVIILLPAMIVFSKSYVSPYDWFVHVWVAIALLWIAIESLADRQKFEAKKLQPKRWVDTWLWKYARHPNYFGEILVWWWIFFMCLPVLTWGEFLSIISPVFVVVLLLYVSGIPLLEEQRDKKYWDQEEYKSWKKSTRPLIPFPW